MEVGALIRPHVGIENLLGQLGEQSRHGTVQLATPQIPCL